MTSFKSRQSVVPLFSWAGLLSPTFLSVAFVSAVFALLVPEDVARESLLSNEFVSTIREILLALSPLADIKAHARTTGFENAAALSHAFMWSALAFLLVFNTSLAIVNWAAWNSWLSGETGSRISTVKARELLVGIFVIVSAPVIFSMIPGSVSVFKNAELGSRVAFALITESILACWQVLTYVWLPLTFRLINPRKTGSK